MSLDKTKNGNISGKTFKDQTEIPFKHDFAHICGLKMIIMQIIMRINDINLFDFKILIIYNIIGKLG